VKHLVFGSGIPGLPNQSHYSGGSLLGDVRKCVGQLLKVTQHRYPVINLLSM
jgi:hypothetical protein